MIVTTEDQNDLEVFTSFCFFSILTVYERMRQERLNGWDECLAILRPKSFYTTLLLMHDGYRVATDHEFLENLETELSPASAAGRTPKNVLISLLHGDPFLAISQNDSVDILCTIKDGVRSMHRIPMSILSTIPLIRGTRSTRALIRWCRSRGCTDDAKCQLLDNMPTGMLRSPGMPTDSGR